MRELVVVTTYKRDALLSLCLDAIRQEDADISIFVTSDRGARSEQLSSVCFNHCTWPTVLPEHSSYGNSLNLITTLRWAVNGKLNPEIIHICEEDTIIHRGWLDWARTILDQSVEIGETGFRGTPERMAYIKKAASPYACALGRVPANAVSAPWYESPCVSWNAESLRLCLDLVPPGYLECTAREQMQKILDAAFPDSKFRGGSAEQDGLMLRCIEHFGWRVAFPPHCFATHLGVSGYNRPGHKEPEGTFEEQVAWYRALLCDKQRRYELFGQEITDREMAGMNI
jgi:hypothetical protein